MVTRDVSLAHAPCASCVDHPESASCSFFEAPPPPNPDPGSGRLEEEAFGSSKALFPNPLKGRRATALSSRKQGTEKSFAPARSAAAPAGSHGAAVLLPVAFIANSGL